MTDYYDNYYFTTNVTSYECPNSSWQCEPVKACARDHTTGASYCCDYADNECWTGATPCATDGSTLTCGSGDTTWCCLDKTEICTQAENQDYICWNKQPSTLLNISAADLERVYSSLSSASPSATSLAFTASSLLAQTDTHSKSTTAPPSSASPAQSSSTSSSAGSIASAASSTTSSSSPSSAPSVVNHSSSSSLSGGAIAGIVIGVVAFLALLIVGLFYFFRRRQQYALADQAAAAPLDGEQKPGPEHQSSYYAPPSELQGQGRGYNPQELPSN